MLTFSFSANVMHSLFVASFIVAKVSAGIVSGGPYIRFSYYRY